MKRAFLVVYEKAKRSYSDFAPDVPGCISVGKSVEQMRAHLREALKPYMEASLEFGDPIPESVTTTITLPLEGETDPQAAYMVERLSITMPRPKTARAKTPSIAFQENPSKKRRVMQAAQRTS